MEELKRLRSKAAAAATTTTAATKRDEEEEEEEDNEQPSWKTWYFPPTYEYGSFIPKMNEKSQLDVIEDEAERAVKNRYEEDEENALREKKRLEKARLYQKSRNLETHKLW